MATPAFSATLAANATAARLRLATLRDGSRDGRLALTDAGLARAQDKLDASGWAGAEAFDPMQCMAPLPGPCQWADEARGIDLEAAVAVITTDVPMGTRAPGAHALARRRHDRRRRHRLQCPSRPAPYLRAGDRVHVEAFDRAGQSVFGAIDQVVSILHTGNTS